MGDFLLTPPLGVLAPDAVDDDDRLFIRIKPPLDYTISVAAAASGEAPRDAPGQATMGLLAQVLEVHGVDEVSYGDVDRCSLAIGVRAVANANNIDTTQPQT